MEMTLQGFFIFLIFLSTIIIIVVFNKKIRFVLKFDLFWKISSLMIVTYVIAGRLVWDWKDGWLPSIFLTDFCPFAATVGIGLAFFKITRRYAEGFAIWMILSSLVTSFQFYVSETNENFFKWFFYGAEFGPKGDGTGNSTPLFIIMHYLLLCYGLLLVLNKSFKRLTWVYAVENSLQMILYLSYVLIIKAATGLTYNITGLGSYDWVYGQYSLVGEVFNLTYPAVLIVGFSLMAIINWSLVGLTFYWKKIVIQKQWSNWFI